MILPTPSRLIERRVRQVFDQIGRNDFAPVLRGMADDVEHTFPGQHPLGGTRHRVESVAAWFQRLAWLFPVHEFDVSEVVSGGPPWRLWVAVKWQAAVRPREGEAYRNEGAHWILIRRGKVDRIHAYLDSQAVASACEQMSTAGVADADAEPIA